MLYIVCFIEIDSGPVQADLSEVFNMPDIESIIPAKFKQPEPSEGRICPLIFQQMLGNFCRGRLRLARRSCHNVCTVYVQVCQSAHACVCPVLAGTHVLVYCSFHI